MNRDTITQIRIDVRSDLMRSQTPVKGTTDRQHTICWNFITPLAYRLPGDAYARR